MTIIFLDIETTGLDPAKDHILQIAMISTDNVGVPDGRVNYQADIALTEAAAGRLYLNPYVRDMHTRTGLLARLEAAAREDAAGRPWEAHDPVELDCAERRAIAALSRLPAELHTLAGNSVHFDLAFLRTHMPRLARCFSHRLLDVSVLRMFEDLHGDGAIDVDNDNAHDAMADVECSIAQYLAYVARRRALK